MLTNYWTSRIEYKSSLSYKSRNLCSGTHFWEWHVWYFFWSYFSTKRNVNNFSFCKGNNISKDKNMSCHRIYTWNVRKRRVNLSFIILRWIQTKIFISRNWIYSSTFILEIGELTHKQVDIRTRRLEKY